MSITLDEANEPDSQSLTERSRAYDHWFVECVEKGLRDVAEGRVLSSADSETRNAARRSCIGK